LVNVLEGRPGAKVEIAGQPPALRNYLGTQCAAPVGDAEFMDVCLA